MHCTCIEFLPTCPTKREVFRQLSHGGGKRLQVCTWNGFIAKQGTRCPKPQAGAHLCNSRAHLHAHFGFYLSCQYPKPHLRFDVLCAHCSLIAFCLCALHLYVLGPFTSTYWAKILDQFLRYSSLCALLYGTASLQHALVLHLLRHSIDPTMP
jgi:hypothetical protein